jgi:gliding motility-associated-like protein
MYIIAYGDRISNCSAKDDFIITIYPLNDLVISGGVICVNSQTGELLQSYQLVSGLNPSEYRVEWYLNGVLMGVGTNYTATEEGTYTVIPIKTTPTIGNDCGYNATRVVVEKSSPAVATVTVSAAFQSVIDIIVNVTNGFGTYEYQIDNGAFQTDNVFYDVASGTHNIIIKDTKGDCGQILLLAHVIKYPNYFTPNGDGYHDTWNIFDLDFQPDAKLYIYDRYGKFLKQLSTTSEGWDGNHNGTPLPSADYWFQVFYKFNGTDQEFKAHFTLKR